MAAGSFDVASQTPIRDLIIVDEEDDNGMHRKPKFKVVEINTNIPKGFYRPTRPVRRIAPKQPLVDIVQSNTATKRRKHNQVKRENQIVIGRNNVPMLSNVVNQPINCQTLPINQVVLNNGSAAAAATMMSFSQPMQTYEFQNGNGAGVQPQTINLNGLQVVQQQQQQQQPQRAPLVLRMINNAGQEQTVIVQNGNTSVVQNASNNGIVFVHSPVDDFNKSQQTSGFGNYVLNPVNQNMTTSNVLNTSQPVMTNLVLNNGQIMTARNTSVMPKYEVQQNNASQQPQIIVVNNIQAMPGGGNWSDAASNYQILTQLPNVNNDVNFMMMQDARNSPSVLNFPQHQQINNVQSQPVYVQQTQPTQQQQWIRPQQTISDHRLPTFSQVKLLQNVDDSQTISRQGETIARSEIVDNKPKVRNESVDSEDDSSGNIIAGARPKRKVREKKLSVVIELSDSEEEEEEEVQEFKQEEEGADLMWDSMVIIENDIQCS